MAPILLIEDDAALAQLLRLLLERDHHTVVIAANGADGMTAALADAAHRPQLILTESSLPDMDGYAIAARLAADLDTSRIPVVLLTAKPGAVDLLAVSSNIVAHLPKPIDPTTLREVLAIALAQKGR